MIELSGMVFYTANETAKMLGITPRTLYRWEASDRPSYVPDFRAYNAPNGRKMYKAIDIERIIEKCFEVKIDSVKELSDNKLQHVGA